MMLPKQIKVGAVNYRVKEKKHIVIEGDSGYAGLCNPNKNKILIKKDLDPQRKEAVLIHELVHAVFFEAGYAYEQEYGPHTEEVVIRFSNVLHQVLVDNPTLLRGLLNEPILFEPVEAEGVLQAPVFVGWTPESLEEFKQEAKWVPGSGVEQNYVHGDIEGRKQTLKSRGENK